MLKIICLSSPVRSVWTVQPTERRDRRRWWCFHENRSSSSSSGVRGGKRRGDPRRSAPQHPSVPHQHQREVQWGTFGPGVARGPCDPRTRASASKQTDHETFWIIKLSQQQKLPLWVCSALKTMLQVSHTHTAPRIIRVSRDGWDGRCGTLIRKAIICL